ncbi:MAG: NUDIX domain-containing protein [bacterium]|nr:NUDIX domain-containing protein [bacterium]
MKYPRINIDILIVNKNKILLGLLTKKWSNKGEQVYGVPGREIYFGEKIGQTVRRNIKEDLGCNVKNYKIISVNANYALGNHYVGIGIVVEIEGEIKNLVPKDWEKWEWFEKYKIPQNLFPATENLINCYLEKKFTVSE